jgi:hypothetical protein
MSNQLVPVMPHETEEFPLHEPRLHRNHIHVQERKTIARIIDSTTFLFQPLFYWAELSTKGTQ